MSETFTLINKGSSPLIIERFNISMPGMKVRVKQEIGPKESALLHIDWDTSRYRRDVEGQAVLFLNDPRNPKVILTVKGVVIPPIDILPLPAFYLSQFKGEETSRSITFKNNQAHKVAILKVSPNGDHFYPAFKSIEKGKVYSITANILSSTPVGRYNESVTVFTDDPKHSQINIGVNILVKPDVFIQPESADYGEISLTNLNYNPNSIQLYNQTFIIKRREGEMEIASIKSDIPFLKLKQEPAGKAKSFRIDVELDRKKIQPGEILGTITILTSDPIYPELVIPVRGEFKP